MNEYTFRWESRRLEEVPPRTSWILSLCRGALCGRGEAAPLNDQEPPEREGKGTTREMEARLKIWPAPFAFGLESAMMELRAREQGLTLRDLVPPDRRVRTHAHVGMPGNMRAESVWIWEPGVEERLRTMGYRVIKAKVRTLDDVVFWVENPPRELQLRLDANRAFGAEHLKELVPMLRRLPLDFVEEPCVWGDGVCVESLARAGIRVALDESLRDCMEMATAWIRKGWVAVAVVKPGLLGPLARLKAFLSALERVRPLPVVLTHLLEGPVGRRHTLFRALTLDLPGVHGLDLGKGSPLGPSHL